MFRRLRPIVLVMAVTAAATTSSIVPAQAAHSGSTVPAQAAAVCRPLPGYHCHALVDFGYAGSTFNGLSGRLYVTCEDTGGPRADNFVDYEFWAIMNVSPQYWTEAGVTIGNGTPNPDSGPYYFIAEQKPTHAYEQHFYKAALAPYKQFIDTYIHYDPRTSLYNVQVGPYAGTSGTGGTQAYPVIELQSGAEITNDNAIVRGTSDNLSWYSTYDVEHTGWENAGHTATLTSLPANWDDAYLTWKSRYTRARVGTQATCG